MTDNKILLTALRNEDFRQVLEKIRELVELNPYINYDHSEELEILLIKARALADALNNHDAHIGFDEILSTVKGAVNEDLDIILGDYTAGKSE